MKTTDIEDIFTVYQTGFHRYISECTPSDYIILIITLAYYFFHQIRQSALDDPENKVMHEVKCLLIIDQASILIAQRTGSYTKNLLFKPNFTKVKQDPSLSSPKYSRNHPDVWKFIRVTRSSGSCSNVMHFKSGKSCIGGAGRRIGAVLSMSTPALSFAMSFSFFLSSCSLPRPHSFFLRFTCLSSFLTFIFFFLFVTRTQRDEFLSRMRFNERESVALARGCTTAVIVATLRK